MALKKEISQATLYSPENYAYWQYKKRRALGLDSRDLGIVIAKAIETVDPTGHKAMRATEAAGNLESDKQD
jgi:hypothetical protein